MDTANIIILIIVGVAAVALIVFLIWKNQQDKKALNPDAGDAVDETIGDQETQKRQDLILSSSMNTA